MVSSAELFIERADNELLLAKMNFDISKEEKLKEILNIPKEKTFFNNVISQAYYSIFYAAKAYLETKNIHTSPPEEHKKTYEEFKKIIDLGELKMELFEIYEKETIKAETLLEIFFSEKRKRGLFTYSIKSEANIPVAQESIENAKKFISPIKSIINEQKSHIHKL